MPTSWDEHASRGNLTVKGRRASGHQAENMAIVVSACVSRGAGDIETCAGAIATAIQESSITNLRGGDRDSAGIFQQRPSMGWGTYAQVTNVQYAANKFASLYVPKRRGGMGWLAASHAVQRSAHPNAPAAWYGEAVRAAQYYRGQGAGVVSATGSTSGTGTSTSITREKPYEFARGSPDNPNETTWDCIGRLASEVKWRRFCDNGRIWYVSEDWLVNRPAVYRMSEGSRGVLEVAFDWETRQEVAEARVKVLASRYTVSIGQPVELVDEGPAGNGKWIVASTRQILTSAITELTLKRAAPKLPEPAPETETIQIGTTGVEQSSATSGTVSGNTTAERIYNAAVEATNRRWSYSQARRNQNGQGGFADCSSGVTWVLQRAGLRGPLNNAGSNGSGGNAPIATSYVNWGQGGQGQRCTIWWNGAHIWIQFKGFPNWRFDTGGGSGGKLWPTPRSTAGFNARHADGT